MPCREISKKRVFNFAKQFEILLQGMHLPKKIAFVFLFFILSFVFLQFHLDVHAEDLITPTPQITNSTVKNNPQDIFAPGLQEIIDEKKAMRKKAEDTGKYQLSSSETTSRNFDDQSYALLERLICPDKDLCNNKQTVISTLTQAIASLYSHPPASGIMYAYDLLHNAGLAKSAYAQGVGFSGLTPLLPLWKTTRNIAYAVLILIMLIIGFMIIFRMKIDPKTVISVQAALPKIVLTLILITFSYAIVGFLIDIMYISMAVVIDVMAKSMGPPFSNDTLKYQAELMTGDSVTLLQWVFGNLQYLGGFFKEFGDVIVKTITAVDIIGMWKMFFGTMGSIGIAVGIPLLFVIIVVLGLIFTFFRLLIMLFNSYMQILISLVLGPLLLLVEAVPGKSAFGGWISNLVANLIVFPTTAMILMFGMYIASLKTGETLWAPPYLAPGPNLFTTFLGLGIVFMAPGLVASVKKIFKPQPIIPLTPGTMMAPVTGSFQSVMGAGQQFYYMGMLKQMLPGQQQPRH